MRPSTDRPSGGAPELPFDEPVRIFFERSVHAMRTRVVLRCAASYRARLDTRLDTTVVAEPSDALVGDFALHLVVDPLERADDTRPQPLRRTPQRLERQ